MPASLPKLLNSVKWNHQKDVAVVSVMYLKVVTNVYKNIILLFLATLYLTSLEAPSSSASTGTS